MKLWEELRTNVISQLSKVKYWQCLFTTRVIWYFVCMGTMGRYGKKWKKQDKAFRI